MGYPTCTRISWRSTQAILLAHISEKSNDSKQMSECTATGDEYAVFTNTENLFQYDFSWEEDRDGFLPDFLPTVT